MNYRHAFHAGNFADVLKHAIFAFMLAHLNKKSAAYRVIDTHAGIGVYDLNSDEASRCPEWRDGVARLADGPPRGAEALLAPYLDALAAARRAHGASSYPGSPAIAALLARRDDAVRLCELHAQDAAALSAQLGRDRRVKVEARDGYGALRAYLPPPERRGVVIVDPPFEAADEFDTLAKAMLGAVRVWRSGVFLVWRPLKDLVASERFDDGLAARLGEEVGLEGEKLLRADLWVRALEGADRLSGAGVLVVNPPYGLRDALARGLAPLSRLLAQDEGAGWRLDSVRDAPPQAETALASGA